MTWKAWRRITIGSSCDFCLMLATRGAVYTSEDAARYKAGGSRYHDHCDCGAELETDPAAKEAVRIDPQDAAKLVRVLAKGRQYRYDLSKYRNLNVANPPRLKPMAKVARPKLAPDTGGYVPGRWTPMTADEIAQELADQIPAHLQGYAAKLADLRRSLGGTTRRGTPTVQHKWRNGNRTAASEVKLTKKQQAQLLDDFDSALGSLPKSVHDQVVELVVPSGDKVFAGSNAAGGYVVTGASRIHIAPAIAKGRRWSGGTGFHPPYDAHASTLRGVLTHELGHVIDNILESTRTVSAGGRAAARQAERKFWEDQFDGKVGRFTGTDWRYARTNAAEAYAEAFAQWVIDGPGSSRIADAYARRYGW